MSIIKLFHIVAVKYHGATNSLGSRVSLYSDRFKKRIFIPYDYAENNIEDMAVNYFLEHGFKVAGYAEGFIILDTFESIEKNIPCKHDSHYRAGFKCTICGQETFETIEKR